MSFFQKLRAWLGAAERDESTPNPQRSTSPSAPAVDVVDLDAAYAAYEAGARFIDVREPDEWRDGHIAGAVHRPVGTLEQQPEAAVARGTPVITYCAAGARAARAAAALAANGYSNVRALDSGYSDWAAAGYPVEHPEETES